MAVCFLTNFVVFPKGSEFKYEEFEYATSHIVAQSDKCELNKQLSGNILMHDK